MVAIKEKKISIAFLEFYVFLIAARMFFVHQDECGVSAATENFRLVDRPENKARRSDTSPGRGCQQIYERTPAAVPVKPP